MKKTTLFEKAFKKTLNKKKKTKDEDENTVGGGALGANAISKPQTLTNTDFYAPGDYRRPFALGAVQTRKGTIGKKRRKRKSKK